MWYDYAEEDMDCHDIIYISDYSVCEKKNQVFIDDDTDMCTYEGFNYTKSDDESDMMKCNDIVQHESDKIDFKYTGCRSVFYLEEVVSSLPHYKAVQLILSYCRKRIIDSGK
jgi:hypothetical protein